MLCLFMDCVGAPFLPAQTNLPVDTPRQALIQKASLLVLPILFYSPETRGGAGLAGLFAFRFRGEKPNAAVSSIQLGLAYTQENQFLSYIPFRLQMGGNRWLGVGELGYYRYRYFFFGIGSHESTVSAELYDVNYPRLRLDVVRRMGSRSFYLGPSLDWDHYTMVRVDENGRLADPGLDIPGRQGGRITLLGCLALYDGRDHIQFPRKGHYFEFRLQGARRGLGNDFGFWRSKLDLRKYFPLGKGAVLAGQFYLESNHGTVPFQAMALLGGSKKLRGYYEGRFRDQKLLLLQLAFRSPLVWRVGLVGFVGLGGVAPQWSVFSRRNFHGAFGGGIRFQLDQEEKINLRLDYAFGQKSKGFYLTIGEAF